MMPATRGYYKWRHCLLPVVEDKVNARRGRLIFLAIHFAIPRINRTFAFENKDV